MQSLDVLPVVF